MHSGKLVTQEIFIGGDHDSNQGKTKTKNPKSEFILFSFKYSSKTFWVVLLKSLNLPS